MARSPSGRRGRGASDLGGTLGSLLRTTLEQAGAVREAFERSARTGLGDRRRTNLLADLGEIVLELVRQGEIDLEELPEIRDAIEALDRHDEGGRDEVRPRSARVTRGYGERDDANLRRAVAQTPRYPFDERDVVGRKRQSGDTQPDDEEEELVEFDNELEGGAHDIPDVAPRGRRGDPEELEQRGLDTVAREAVTQRLRSFTDPLRRAFARGFDRSEAGDAGDDDADRDDFDDRDDAELLAAAARGEGLGDRDDAELLAAAARRQSRDRQAGPTRPGYLKKGEAILRTVTGQASAPRRRESTDDGTVSSTSWRRDPAAKTQRVWRPVFDDVPEESERGEQGSAPAPAAPASAAGGASPRTPAVAPAPAAAPAPKAAPIDDPIEIPGVSRYDDLHAAATADEPERPSRPSPLSPSAGRSGGISFEDDDDLEQYMHPDDVPQKPGPA